jgi:hypothetical protein
MGGYEYVSRAELNHTYLVRAIRSALSFHELDQQRRSAEEIRRLLATLERPYNHAFGLLHESV